MSIKKITDGALYFLPLNENNKYICDVMNAVGQWD